MWLHWSPRLHWSADWLAWSIKIWRTTGYLCEPKSSGRAVLGKTTLGSKIWESGGPSSPREWSAKGQKRRWPRGGQGRRGGELAFCREHPDPDGRVEPPPGRHFMLISWSSCTSAKSLIQKVFFTSGLAEGVGQRCAQPSGLAAAVLKGREAP